MHAQPSIVFLNGEYWGVHILREKLDEHHIENLLGIDKDSIDYLLIRGGGDPSFSINDLESFILKIRATGIREIRNGIHLDQSFFNQRKKSTGSFDQSPLRPYNTMHSSLIVNSNKLDLSFRFNSKTKEVVITPSFT